MSTPHSNGVSAESAPAFAQRGDCAWTEQLTAAELIKDAADYRVRREERKAKGLDRLATVIGALAMVLAATAAITAVPNLGSGWISASCAFISALSAGLTMRFHPADTAQHLRAESIQWYDLIDATQRFDRLVRREAGSLSSAEIEKRLHALQMQRDHALRAAVAGENAWLSHERDRGRPGCGIGLCDTAPADGRPTCANQGDRPRPESGKRLYDRPTA